MGGIDYHRVFEVTDDALLVCDVSNGRLRDSNPAARELLGLDADALSGVSLSELFDSVDGSSPMDAYRDRSDGTDGVTVSATVAHPDAVPVSVDLRLASLSADRVLVTVAVAGDDGAGHQLPNPGVLSQLVEHTPDVMWMFSADWEEYVFVNSAYEDVFGRSLSDLRADPTDFLNGVHPDDRADVRAAMKRLSAGQTIDIEYRTDPTSDFERYVWVHGIPIRNDDGEVYRVAGFTREITERNEHEMELLRQRNLVRNVPVGVFRVALDEGRRLLQANPALVSMLGADGTDDLVGRSVAEFYHDSDLEPRIADRLDDEGTITFETQFETLAGDVFWGRVTTVRQTDDAGRPIADGVIEDITTRKHRQRQLRVVDRILRHNIRNDVSVISGYATYLDEKPDVSAAEPIRAIRDRSRKLLRTAEKGHVVVDVLSNGGDPVTFDVVPDIEGSVERLRETHEGAVIETTLPDAAAVSALREIDLALYELVENSIVHHEGTPTIGIAVATADDGVQIRINDDGPGIPQREYEILSGTEDVDPLSHGSGMGLWLVHWIVRLSGGDIAFESSNNGSTVVVTLPAGEDEDATAGQETDSSRVP
ncbi:PAS domain S-box protein [Halorientalis marina]|uniref:PAS domain S-box protein n=1 Tax=Halorientalis marina TaxID=2931976 RepID=UPI001FF506AE|nr:PAS domain S-box protein [Halorientalis marina]